MENTATRHGDDVTEQALRTLDGCPDPRLREVTAALLRHLHAFVREVRLTPDEWMAGIQFLTRVGQKCDAIRQEFILLSDTTGVTMAVDAVAHDDLPKGATASSALGPFYTQ